MKTHKDNFLLPCSRVGKRPVSWPLAPLALEVAKIDAESQESSYSFPESKGLTGVYSGLGTMGQFVQSQGILI